MKKFKIGQIQLIITIFVWVLLFFIPVVFGEFKEEIDWTHVFRLWKEYVIVFLIFLINRLVLLPYLFFRSRRVLYFISITGLVVVFIFTMYNIRTEELKQDARISEILQNEERPDVFNRPDIMPEDTRRFGPPGLQREEHRDSISDGVGKAVPPEDVSRRGRRPGPPGLRPDGKQNGIPGIRQGRPKKMSPPLEIIPPFANLLLLTILLLGFDTGLVFSIKWLKAEQTKIKLEKENMENKMAFLQNQISPHFFMNTLNNIHALVDISSEEAKDSIIKLSRMMAYMLYESRTEKVPLQKEMDFIRSYIELMKIRFTDQVEVVLDIPKVLPPVKIPPLLTISYIENAFKHGISYNEPCFVHISFSFDKERMSFDITNKVFERKSTDSHSGVGMENAKNRLELVYGKKYKLKIGKLRDANLFAVNLNVPI